MCGSLRRPCCRVRSPWATAQRIHSQRRACASPTQRRPRAPKPRPITRVLGPHCQPRTPPGSEQTWLHVDTPASLEHAPQRWSTWVDSLARALPNNLLARAHLIAVHIRLRLRRWHRRVCVICSASSPASAAHPPVFPLLAC